MSTFYLDYVNGNDASSGADWANAWKTFTSGATAARIAPGDVIRIAKSPDPTSLGMTATWTNLSRTVTLNSALTATIDDCEDAWVASANVTCTTSTTNKLGTNSSSIAIAAGFTTGLVAYEALAAGTVDFSGYQQISFWIRPNAAVASGVLTLSLCSDASGATPVNTVTIPQLIANSWHCITLDTGGALGSSIQSVALNAVSDPGTVTVLLDNVIACKASSSADSLSLTSLISKNTLAQGGAEGWFGIQSINGTTVILDAGPATEAGVGEGYSGTTETVTTYKRETIKTTVVTGITSVNVINDDGSAGSNIEYQGGFDTSSSLQNGETFFDGTCGTGKGIIGTARSYNTLNWIAVCRYETGFFFNSTCTYITLDNISNANNNSGPGISFDTGSGKYNTINNLLNANNNTQNGLVINQTSNFTLTSCTNINNNTSSGLTGSCSVGTIGTLSNANNNGSSGISLSGSTWYMDTLSSVANNGSSGLFLNGYTTIRNALNVNNNTGSALSFSQTGGWVGTLTSTGNGTAGITQTQGESYIHSWTSGDSTPVVAASFANRYVRVGDFNGAGVKIFTDGGDIISETSTLTNGSGIQWKFTTATNTNRDINYPLKLSIAKIAVTANNLVTVKAWFKKGHATNIGAKLVCRGGQIAGVTSDVVATKANDTSEEELTITFTPTAAGVVEIEAWAYYVAGHSTVIVDAMTITQA